MIKPDAILMLTVTGVAAALSFSFLGGPAASQGMATYAANIQPLDDKILLQSTTQREVTGKAGTMGYSLAA